MFNDKPKWRHNTNISNGCRCHWPEPTLHGIEINVAQDKKKAQLAGFYNNTPTKTIPKQQINKSRLREKKNNYRKHSERQKEAPQTQCTDRRAREKKTVFAFFVKRIWNVENKNPASIFTLVVWANAANIDSYGILNEKVHVNRSMRFFCVATAFLENKKATTRDTEWAKEEEN